jgi:hypothetical protein
MAEEHSGAKCSLYGDQEAKRKNGEGSRDKMYFSKTHSVIYFLQLGLTS